MVGALLLVAAAFLPAWARPIAASAIREALRGGLPPSATVEVSVSLGWTSPPGAVVDVTEGDEVDLRVELSTRRGLLGWVGPALGGSFGEVPIEFAIDARLEGEAGRDFLEGIRARAAGGDMEDSGPVGESGDASGGTEDVFRGGSIVATGSVELEIVDRERGIDLAIASDRVETSLSADRTLDAALELRVARDGAVDRSDGRVRIEGSLAKALRGDGSLDLAAAVAELAIDADAVEFEWGRETVTIESLRLSAAALPEAGMSLEVDGSGSVGGRGAVVETDLAWRRPFDERGDLRGDLFGLGGDGRLSGVPIASLTGGLSPDLARIVEALGPTLDAEWALPIDADAVTLSARAEHADVAASARLARASGRLSDGAVRIDAELAPPSSEEAAASSERVPVRLVASGTEYRDGELSVAAAEFVADGAATPLIALLGSAGPVEPLAGGPIELRADAIRWPVADGIAAIEARGRLDSPSILRLRSEDGDFETTVSRVRIEWFAEPLGRALSVRGEIGVDDGTLRFDERLEGLWTGSGWLPPTSLRPHGTASLEGVDPALLTPLLPEPMRVAWTRQAATPLELRLSTRVEGDRLEGEVRTSGADVDLRLPLSIDTQRIAIGPVEGALRLDREALAALPKSWTGGVAVATDLEATLSVAPILLPVEVLSGVVPEMPTLAAAMAIERVPVAAAPGLAADASVEVRDLEARVSLRSDGGRSLEAGARVVCPSSASSDASDALGEFRLAVASSGDGGTATVQGEVSSLEASALLSMLDLATGSVLETPESRDWIGPLDLRFESRDGDALAISARGATLDATAVIARTHGTEGTGGTDGAEEAGGGTATLETLELSVTMPPAAVATLAGDVISPFRPIGDARIRVRARDVGFEADPAIGEVVVELDPIALVVGGADPASPVSLAGHRVSLSGDAAGRGPVLRLGPMRGAAEGATVGFDGRLSQVDGSDAWTIDGTGSVRGLPTAVLDGVVDGGELVVDVLGSSVDATFSSTALGVAGGELGVEATFPNGTVRLPSLVVGEETLRIPAGSPFTGELRFGDGLAALLEDLSPMLGSIASLEAPVRLTIADAVLPRTGVDRRLLSGDLRLDVGRGEFRPRGPLRLALAAFGDANATGFAGEVAPLVAAIREGRLEYRNFETRFVPYGSGWRNTVVSSGSIDLASEPPMGRFTMAFPATSLAAYSGEIRGIMETRPRLLESIEVPLILEGPLDGSAPLATSIEFDPKPLIEAGVEILIEEGFRRLFEGLK